MENEIDNIIRIISIDCGGAIFRFDKPPRRKRSDKAGPRTGQSGIVAENRQRPSQDGHNQDRH